MVFQHPFRSHNSEDLHDDRAREVRQKHGQHEDAECAADDDAEDAVELGEELGADKLRLKKQKRSSVIRYMFSRKKINETSRE